MAQSTVKTTLNKHTVEITHTPTAGAKTCDLKNRQNRVLQWSWNPGVVANGGNVIGPNCVIKGVPVPAGSPTLYVLGYNVADVLEVEYT